MYFLYNVSVINLALSKSTPILYRHAIKSDNLIFEDTKINITVNGKRHLGEVIGSEEYRDDYVINKADQIANEQNNLCEIAKVEPQAQYSCFVSGFKHKLNYIMRTIPNISHLLKPIDDIILTKFIPAITDGIKINQVERKILSLPAKYGGLAIPIFAEIQTTNTRTHSTSPNI